MERFAKLYAELDGATCAMEKSAALERYFREAAPADAAFDVSFLPAYAPKPWDGILEILDR